MSEMSTEAIGCELEKFQECKKEIEELINNTQHRIKEQGISDAALEDRLKDLDWAMKTAERLLALVPNQV